MIGYEDFHVPGTPQRQPLQVGHGSLSLGYRLIADRRAQHEGSLTSLILTLKW